VTCDIGQAIFKSANYCPAVIIEDGLYYCRLIRDTAKYISPLVGAEDWKTQVFCEFFKKVLGIGYGCTNGVKTGEDDTRNKMTLEQIWEEIMKEPVLATPFLKSQTRCRL
jgi:hypothetical protein